MKKKSLIEQVGEYNKLYEQARIKLLSALKDVVKKCEFDVERMSEEDEKAIFYRFGDQSAQDISKAYKTFSKEREDFQRIINPESSDL